MPHKLEKHVKELILHKYSNVSEKCGPKEVNYILDKIDDKLTHTCRSQTSWIADLSAYHKSLFELFKNYIMEKEKISIDACRSIIGCLVYFIDPFDVIPDYTPGIGYVDDLFVLLICVKSFHKADLERVRTYLNRYSRK
ncbi:MAG: DUF1232 domain-containing protein [Chitinophagales bacterium]|nr:DUF1232 domain-containing protein [Chitinophagales bacterium]HOM96946.1 YkvA family protein [Acetomicrobium sp.]